MGLLSKAAPISELGQRSFWIVYGKSNSGKTHFIGTFPKPLLYVQIGDDGSNTISNVDGIDAVSVDSPAQLLELAEELKTNKKYKTIAVDTFSLVTNEWTDQNAIKKKKRMTQQMWGDLKIDTEELIKAYHKLARDRIVVLTCHEATDSIEGMEDEITPDVRPSVTKGARTYLEGMANYGIHTTKVSKEVQSGDEVKEVIKYAADIGPNPYYWTKFQIDSSIKLPKRLLNPSYEKVMKIISSEK